MGPPQDDGPGIIFHCGRIFTIVEGPWPNITQKAPVSFNVHSDRRSLCNHRRSLLNRVGGLGALSVPQLVQGKALGGVQGEKPPKALRTLHLQYRKIGLKQG